MKKYTLPLLLACATLPAFADGNDAAIRNLFEEKLHGKIEQINKTPLPGIYEVVADGQVVYIDEKATYFIAGNLVQTKDMKNLTAEKKAQLVDKKLAQLPYEQAIKQVRGDRKSVV